MSTDKDREEASNARTALTYLWDHPEVQKALDQWIDLSIELAQLAGSERNDEQSDRRCRRLVRCRRTIADAPLSATALRRILNRLP